MANPLQIANKSKLIVEKSRLLLNNLMQKYQQGEIKTVTELQYRLYIALEDLYTQVGKPTMKERLAWGPPMSEDYNQTMIEVYNDIQTLFSESDGMSGAVQESFEQVELDRQIMNWQMTDINDRLKDIELKMNQSKGEVVFRDSFLNTDSFDKDMVILEPATINASEGVLSLTKIDAEEFNEGVTVRILEGNGFVGNTHQVRGIDGTYRFFGEDNLHFDLISMVDGNSDTWFEYETFTISDEVEALTNSYGFEYKEGMKWVKEQSGSLRLYIEIELPIAQTVNWLSIAPFIPSDKGATPPVIRSLVVYDGKGAANEVSSGYDVMNEDKVFIFPRQKCKRITLQLEQSAAYETLIGHFFFKELEAKTVNFMAKEKEQKGRRIDGPKPSVESLFYKYNSSTKLLQQPERIEGGSGPSDSQEIKNALFSVPAVKGQVQAGLEAVSAKRYVIGVRDIGISAYRFAEESEYISKQFVSTDEIKKITLDANHLIPKEFGEGGWVRYFISVDDGRNWNEIAPKGTSKSGSKVQYIINGNVPIEGRFDNYGYIDTLKPIYSVRLKIQLERPIELMDSDYYTPIVYDYKVRCITAKGVI